MDCSSISELSEVIDERLNEFRNGDDDERMGAGAKAAVGAGAAGAAGAGYAVARKHPKTKLPIMKAEIKAENAVRTGADAVRPKSIHGVNARRKIRKGARKMGRNARGAVVDRVEGAIGGARKSVRKGAHVVASKTSGKTRRLLLKGARKMRFDSVDEVIEFADRAAAIEDRLARLEY